MTVRWRKWLLLFVTIAVVLSLAVWLFSAPGYTLPLPSGIASMEARFTCSDCDQRTFVVPRDLYGEILSALSPASYDRFPAKWQVLGELEIRTYDGKALYVGLFDVESSNLGAFAAGPDFESRTYYRGGNSRHLRIALAKALAESAVK